MLKILLSYLFCCDICYSLEYTILHTKYVCAILKSWICRKIHLHVCYTLNKGFNLIKPT